MKKHNFSPKQLLLITALTAALSCSRPQPESFSRTFSRMDTFTKVTLVAGAQPGLLVDSISAARLLDGIDSLLQHWEERFSQTGEQSEVKKLNERRDSGVLSDELIMMAAMGQAYGDTTSGMFDLTILPVKEAWGFGEESDSLRLPAQAHLDSLLGNVGHRLFTVNGEARRIEFAHDGVRIDVGGIAKGMALRDIGMYLENVGIVHYLVVAGGDILCRGKPSQSRPWRIGIQHPRVSQELLATLELNAGAVVTSGDYERFYERNGNRYHHLFNPRTGQSCTANRSLTIAAPDPLEADILSTGLFCLSAGEIMAFVELRPRLNCVVVDSSGVVHISSRWREQVRLN